MWAIVGKDFLSADFSGLETSLPEVSLLVPQFAWEIPVVFTLREVVVGSGEP